MQVNGNMTPTNLASSATAVGRGATTSGGNNAAGVQSEATQQQSTPPEASIISLMQQDGVVVNFSIDKETNEFVVKVINPFTNQVIKQIPPEELVNLASSIQQIAGVLVDKQV